MNSTLINENEFLENSILSKKDLEDYDLERTFYMVNFRNYLIEV